MIIAEWRKAIFTLKGCRCGSRDCLAEAQPRPLPSLSGPARRPLPRTFHLRTFLVLSPLHFSTTTQKGLQHHSEQQKKHSTRVSQTLNTYHGSEQLLVHPSPSCCLFGTGSVAALVLTPLPIRGTESTEEAHPPLHGLKQPQLPSQRSSIACCRDQTRANQVTVREAGPFNFKLIHAYTDHQQERQTTLNTSQYEQQCPT